MEETTIPVTPEVAPAAKSKPKRSAKPKSDQPGQPQNSGNSTIETHPAPESALPANGAAKIDLKTTEHYAWDRTIEEDRQRATDDLVRRTLFPVPPAKTVPFEKFVEYWGDLIKLPVSKYARLHVRRWYPVCLPEETEDSRTGLKREGFPGEKSLIADFGPLNEQRILDEFGVGDYTIRLNDTRRPFEQATIIHCEKFATRRDYANHPPDFKLSRLDWDDPSNGPYIKWAQSRGILPMEREFEKEQADMATEAVLTQLLQQNKQLTDQVINTKPTPPPAPAPPPKSENGDGGAMKAVVDLATAALNRPQPAIPPASDPMVMVRGMVDIIKEIKPAPDTSATDLAKQVVAQAASANDRIYQLQKDQMDQMRADLKDAKTPAAAVTPAAPPTLAQQFQEMETVMGAAKRIARGGAPEEQESSKPSNIDKWLEAAPILGPIVQSFVQGIFQTMHFGLQTWQTISYNNALAKNGEPRPPTTMEKQPEPGKPMPPQGPPPTPEQTAQAQQMPLILAAVSQIIGPLQRALNNSKTGDEFAESMIDFTSDGRADYDRVRNVAETLIRLGMQVPGQPGVEQFKNAAAYLFQQFPAFWAKVGPLPTFGAFLEEFYDYDRIAAQKQQEGV
jgi:hypothetical protein